MEQAYTWQQGPKTRIAYVQAASYPWLTVKREAVADQKEPPPPDLTTLANIATQWIMHPGLFVVQIADSQGVHMPTCGVLANTNETITFHYVAQGAQMYQRLLDAAPTCCASHATAQLRQATMVNQGGGFTPQAAMIDPEETPILYSMLCYFSRARAAYAAQNPSHPDPGFGRGVVDFLEDTNASILTSNMVSLAKYRIVAAPGTTPHASVKSIAGLFTVSADGQPVSGGNEPVALQYIAPLPKSMANDSLPLLLREDGTVHD